MSLGKATVVQSSVSIGDPHICSDSVNRLSITFNVYDALVRRDDAGYYHPSLAESWSVDESVRSWMFKLRSGVKFHNGDILHASDVVETLGRVLDPSIGGAFGTQGVYSSYLGDAKISAVDDLKVQIVTGEPMADLLDLIVAMPISPESCLDRLPGEYVGSGPYLIAEQGKGRTMLEAHEEYWGSPPEIGEINWIAERSPAKRVDLLLEGGADIACGIGLQGKDTVNASAESEVATLESGLCIIYMCNAQKGPCSDRRVRQALNYALDMDEIIQEIKKGAATPLNGYLTPHHFGYNPDTPAYPYDPDKAKSLLAEAGYSDDLRLVVDIPSVMPNEAPMLSQLMAEQYQKVGVSMEVVEHSDSAAYADMVKAKEMGDACCFDSSPRSTFRVLREKLHSGLRGPWWQGYTNREVDELIEKAQATISDTERKGIYRKVYSMVRDDAPWLFLYRPTSYWGVGPNMKGWKPKSDGTINFTK